MVRNTIKFLLLKARAGTTSLDERKALIDEARGLCRLHKLGMIQFDWPDENSAVARRE